MATISGLNEIAQTDPHPYISTAHLAQFVGRPVAFVGRVKRVFDGQIVLIHSDAGKCSPLIMDDQVLAEMAYRKPSTEFCLGKEVKVIGYHRSDIELVEGVVIEVRGIVNQDHTIKFGDLSLYEGDFDFAAHENMLKFLHGICKSLCYN